VVAVRAASPHTVEPQSGANAAVSERGTEQSCSGNQASPKTRDEQLLEQAYGLIVQGRAALKDGDVDCAGLCARQALEHGGEQLNALLLLHDVLGEEGADGRAREDVLRRILRQNPNLLLPTTELAYLLFSRGERAECERHARDALRLAPRNSRAHGIMGLILTETGRAAAGEIHLRRAIAIAGHNAYLASLLANCLKAQGKLDEAADWFRKASVLEPDNAEIWTGWCRLEEARRDMARAWELLGRAERARLGSADLRLTKAVLLGREGRDGEAIAELSQSQAAGKPLAPAALLERGRLYDRMGRFDEAWADFTEGKRLFREVQGWHYEAAQAKTEVEQLKKFFTRSRMELVPRAALSPEAPQPIFIVGFPRSGTTMVEQIMSAHHQVGAGDELPLIHQLSRLSSRWLGSPYPYPMCLADLWMGDNRLAPDQFRDHYLKGAQQLGVRRPGARYFTDKMPLNETHLGLIHILFPQAPIIHVRRHPLDVVVSNFANFLTHGFHQAFDVETCATHYRLIDGLVGHYRRELDLNCLEISYEDLVCDPEAHIRRLLAFAGLDFDRRCLAFHENRRYARTASYAQVSEKLYGRSVNRHRHYRKYLDAAVSILSAPLGEEWRM